MRALTLNASLALSLRTAHRTYPLCKSIAKSHGIRLEDFSFELYQERLEQAAQVVGAPRHRKQVYQYFGEKFPKNVVRDLKEAACDAGEDRKGDFAPLIFAASSVASVIDAISLISAESFELKHIKDAKKLACVSLRKSTHCALLAETLGTGEQQSKWFFDCLQSDNEKLIELGHKKNGETFDRGEPIKLVSGGPLGHSYVTKVESGVPMKKSEIAKWFKYSNGCSNTVSREIKAFEQFATDLLEVRVGQTPVQYKLQQIMSNTSTHAPAAGALALFGGFIASQTDLISPATGFAAAGGLAIAITATCIALDESTNSNSLHEFQ